MKIRRAVTLASLLVAPLLTAQAQTTLTAWTFDNVPAGINSSPPPSTGLGTASALGMGNSYDQTNSISNPDVQSLAGSSAGGANAWRVRAQSTIVGSGGNGWSTNAPIGTQGAEFAGSTYGYYRIKVSFDVYATADAEADLLVQYTTDGSNWNNAPITSAGTLGVIVTNTDPAQSTVLGSYVKLGSGWNNQITADLSGLSGVDSDAHFAVRVVNASTGTNCVDTTGALYNNASGSWTFDNVAIQGASIDTIADWTFDNYTDGEIVYHPVPIIGDGSASSIGMDNDYTFAGGAVGSTNYPDIKVDNNDSSSGANGPLIWRVRGEHKPNNGWNTEAPIGTQGAQFDVDTSGYSNIVCSFDLYFTSKAEAKMCVLYTTNGWTTTNVAQTLFNGSWPQFMTTNPPPGRPSSANTVAGTYFYQTIGQGFYNDFIVDFTGVPGVGDNPQFGFRIVNAATGGDCVAFNGGSYNNQSGNWRYDNVVVGGTAAHLPPTIADDPNATVDGPFTNTFTDDPGWRSKIAAIYVNGTLLSTNAYSTDTPGMIIFTPANSPLLQASGDKNLVIVAPGYGTGKVTQPLAAGVATRLAITTQAAGPSASGGTLTANPVLAIVDQYGNGTTNPYAAVTATASVGTTGGWTLGGDTTQTSVDGILAFTNLTATLDGSTAVSNAFITFTVTGYPPVTVTNSATFNIGVPPAHFTPGDLAVLQLDRTKNNTTFSIIELKPSLAGQTAPVNIVPISATGTNALRLSSSGSCGRLSLSDDGRLVCFAAFRDGSAATPDETYNYNRAGAGLDYAGQLVMGLRYVSTSLNGSEARSCVQLSDGAWVVDDKGGLYEGTTNNGILLNPNVNAFNNVCVRSFGGNLYVETQKSQNGQIIPAVYKITAGGYEVPNNLGTEPEASDFYLVSTNGGASYDILYVLAANSPTNGVIKKYSWAAGADPINGYGWATNGSITLGTGGECLFATTNGNGGVCLYVTTAESPNNRLVRLTDASGWNASINIVSSNVLYTATGDTYLDGVTFVPQQATNAVEPTPPPVLTTQAGVMLGSAFTITSAPDDPTWRSAITAITVNGSALPAAAYNATQAGQIAFDPSQSALLQSPGAKQIVISATGYSEDSVVQTIAVQRPLLSAMSMSGGKVSIDFTNAPGLTFSVLATNNLAAPVATWPVVGQAVESPAGSGRYQFSAPNSATHSAQFYILRQP